MIRATHYFRSCLGTRQLPNELRILGLSTMLMGFSAFAYGESVTYSVPVPVELKAHATFPLKTAVIQKTKTPIGDDLRMVYQLPAELVGVASPIIELSGSIADAAPNLPFDVSGPLAHATCLERAKIMTCKIQMKPEVTNIKAAQKYLDGMNVDANKRSKLSEVMMRFSGDPIGVIEYED